MDTQSDTPETDHALHRVWYRGDHGSAIPALCRRLERERDAAIQKHLVLLDAVRAMIDAKGRYHTQLATERLIKIVEGSK